MTRLSQWREDRETLAAQGITLPPPSSDSVVQGTGNEPRWIHIGGGNLYRALHGQIAQDLIDEGGMESGIAVFQIHSPHEADHVYGPYGCSTLQVVLEPDGSLSERVIASTSEMVDARPEDGDGWQRTQELFSNPELEMVTLSITEKGYALPKDLSEETPEAPQSAMGIVAALLLERYRRGAAPVAMVSTDNFSRNGEVFRGRVVALVEDWAERGLVEDGFVSWVSDESQVSFPWTMIDRIVPNPSPEVEELLAERGWEDLTVVERPGNSSVAGFVNCEGPWYLVVEDSFPNGRPSLEDAGVAMADRATAEKADTMKVTACLNPLHTALAVYGCLLDHDRIWKAVGDEDLKALVTRIGKVEDLPVVEDPGIINPDDFLDELLEVRLPNRGLPDTPQRIATDTSQKVPIRYGHTLRAYQDQGLPVEGLVGIPLAIAGWLRYLMAVDDKGEPMAVSPDPRGEELMAAVAPLTLGATTADQVHQAAQPILSDPTLFGVDLYELGLGEKIEALLLAETAGPGAVRKTLQDALGEGVDGR